MTRRIRTTAAILGVAGAIGLTGPASAAPSTAGHIAGTQCPNVCITLYDPVTCWLSDGSLLTFGNRCEAEVYACEQELFIILCVPKPA